MKSPRATQKNSPKGKGLGNPFDFFKIACAETFDFLIKDFGFRYVSTIEDIPDCAIEYEKGITSVTITYELNSQVSVDITKREVNEDRTYDLLLLIEMRRHEIDLRRFYGADKDWTNEFLQGLLHKYATFLTEDARDVLTGNFSISQELKALRAHHRRQSNKELFGTYSGESPRFDTRPNLVDVFAGVTDRQKEFRIYEAHWDHRYSADEIADFLGLTREAVDRALSDYDDRI